MNKTLGLSIIALFLFCTPARYFLVSHDELRQEILTNGKLPAKRYLIVPSEYRNSSLGFIQTEPSKSVIELLKKGEIKNARKLLSKKSFEDKMSCDFAWALITLFDGHYDSCSFYIREMNEYSQNCFLQFISMDCNYENDRLSGSVDYKNYLKKYQNVLDCANDDELHVELVKTRLKLIRYGY
jgi:hypothetical protein